jgi:ribosomal protein S18 acetylase RimI-like enzyme
MDAEMLGALGPAAYAGAYAYLWDNPDAYLRHLETFGRHSFETLLGRPDARVWAADSNGVFVGFLSMIIGSLDPIERRGGGAELPRIYLLKEAQHMGIGRRLLAAAIEQARANRLSYIWLDVRASADWARRAYVKWGFKEIGITKSSNPVKDAFRELVVMTMDIVHV